ncbi:MAG: class I adenylate-forming enzyme family protein [Solirubrobacteraceae bacterium]
MIELLQAAAERCAACEAVVLNDRSVEYSELVERALAFAAGLRERGIARFGIVSQNAATVLALLAGASLSGSEACVYAPLDTRDLASDTAGRLDHATVITDEPTLTGDFEALAFSDLAADAAGPAPEPPASRPLLVLTTGTTGTPRGVRHDWARILRSVRHVGPGMGERWLLAYGLHQFAGLQILNHVMAAGATLVAPQPRRPREGLDAMRAHGVTHASATPTFWRFVLAEMHSDGGPVPELRQITLGGEPASGSVLSDLATDFPQAHISHVYAGNEFGPTGSVRDGHSGLPVSVLERDDEADVALKVVDGELWIRSRVGMLGYYGEPAIDPDGWRPTGDQVAMVGDRIMFRGRSSEIINVGGVKVHPLPIEERLGGVPGVKLVRVYGRPNPMTGSIVAAEIVADVGVDTDVLGEALRESCADLPTASRPRSIRFVESIALAGETKIKRS